MTKRRKGTEVISMSFPPPSAAREQQGQLKEAKGSQPNPATAPASFGDEPEISALPATETTVPSVPGEGQGCPCQPLG